jgi:hypothetical protein
VTSFVSQHRMEPPRVHVTIITVDTVKLTAVGLDTRNMGPVTIDLSVHNSQTVIYPREGEEWFLTKINDIWVLDKKGGFGNEGLLREALPGDLVTVTDGNYVLDSATTQIVGPTTVEGHLTANTDFSVWGNTDLGDTQIYGVVDQRGHLHMHGYHIYNEGGSIFTGGGNIICTQINCGNIWAEQIVGTKNAFFDLNVQASTMHCINTLTSARQDVYGPTYTHGNSIDTQGGSVYTRNLEAWGGNIWAQGAITADNYIGSRDIWSGNSHMNGDGFGIGNAWMNGSGHFTPNGGVDFYGCFGSSASFGGMGFNGNGIVTGWRTVDAGFGWVWAGAFITNICEERFKRDIAPIEESQLDTVLAAPLYNFRYDPEAINNVAPDVASVPEAPDVGRQTTEAPDLGLTSTGTSTSAPDLINAGVPEDVAEAWRFGPMADDLPDHLVGETSIGKGPDLGAMVNTLWGAVQELNEKLEAANEKIAALTTRLEVVEARS